MDAPVTAMLTRAKCKSQGGKMILSLGFSLSANVLQALSLETIVPNAEVVTLTVLHNA
jgi:hypothetical protein